MLTSGTEDYTLGHWLRLTFPVVSCSYKVDMEVVGQRLPLRRPLGTRGTAWVVLSIATRSRSLRAISL